MPKTRLYSVSNLLYHMSMKWNELPIDQYKDNVGSIALHMLQMNDEKLFKYGLRVVSCLMSDQNVDSNFNNILTNMIGMLDS